MSKNKESQPEKSQSDIVNANLPRQKIVWMALSAVLFVISVIAFVYAFTIQSEIDAYDENLTNCSLMLSQAEEELKTKDRDVQNMERQLTDHKMGYAGETNLQPEELNRLKRLGYQNPEIDIKADLMKRTDLIPFTVKTGGTLRIYNNQTYILSNNRVFTNFGYGAVKGWMYLKYTAGEDRKIEWKVIDAYCPNCEKK